MKRIWGDAMLGYAFCGSFCTHARALAELQTLLREGFEIQPIFSETAAKTDTRFGKAADLVARVEELTGHQAVCTVADAEPLGPSVRLEALVISPCTGNTLAKLANGVTDTAVTMAAKAHLRSDRPLLIAPASNDALSANLVNIGTLLNRKEIYFVPMRQDDPENKPHSLVADFPSLYPALLAAMDGRQFQKIFL